MSFFFHTTPYPVDATSSATVTVGHDATDGSIKTGTGKLILSASSNVVHVSSSLDFSTVPERQYHIRAVNGHLILSSSGGSTITVSGAIDLIEAGSTIKNYSPRSTTGDLVLSSSSTSVVSISASLRMISQTSKNYHIAGSNDLIFSSTVGNITFSGACETENNGKAFDLRNKTGHLILSSSVGSVVALSSSLYASGSAHAMTGTLRLDPNLDLSNANSIYHIRTTNSHLILSSTVGSTIVLSASTFAMKVSGNGNAGSITWNDSAQMGFNAAGGFTFNNAGTLGGSSWACTNNVTFTLAGQGAYLRNSSAHLILSSSAGSTTAISGGLRLGNDATGSLVAPAVGTMLWHTTTNQMAVWNGVNWYPIASGAAL